MPTENIPNQARDMHPVIDAKQGRAFLLESSTLDSQFYQAARQRDTIMMVSWIYESTGYIPVTPTILVSSSHLSISREDARRADK